MTGVHRDHPRIRRVVLWSAGALTLAAVLAGWRFWTFINPHGLKGHVEAYLSQAFEGEVTIDTLQGRLFPSVGVSGSGIVVRVKGRTDVPPLLNIERFEISGSFRQFMQTPHHVSEVRLQGLRVQIPPGDDNDSDEPDVQRTDAEEIAAARKYEAVIIDRFEAPDTVLTLIPRKAGKPPKVFTIHHLVMESVGSDSDHPVYRHVDKPDSEGGNRSVRHVRALERCAPGKDTRHREIHLRKRRSRHHQRTFGNSDVRRDFTGPLNRIEVQGTTETPDFQVDAGGKAVPLTTKFTAMVDGSDGDTYLNQVDAKFLDTNLVAKGLVIGLEGVKGRQVEVDVTMTNGRIEDLLRLAVDSDSPIVVGPAQLQARLVVPAEKGRKVIDKLMLNGSFGLTQAKFTDASVQQKLIGLSRHGQGKTNGEPIDDVLSNLKGRFVVEDAVVSFSQLTFGVPGALVALTGSYGMRAGSLDFHGQLRLQATLSEVAGGGVRGFFLKAFDPFFKEPGAGTVLPIKITGTRKEPKFGLDLFGTRTRSSCRVSASSRTA